MVIVEAAAAASAVLSVLSLLSLKMSLAASTQYVSAKQQPTFHNESPISCGNTLKFLVARFTLWEVLAVRQSKYKLNQLASWVLLAVLNVLTDQARWWGWTIASVPCLMGFIIAEMHIYRTERRAIEEQHKEPPVDWRRPLLYGSYGLLTVIGCCSVVYSLKYSSPPNLQERAISFGVNVAIDQVIARPLLLLLMSSLTSSWRSMIDLQQQYTIMETRSIQRIEIQKPCAPASPSKANKNRSPSRVPKAKLSLQPEHLIIGRKVSSPQRADQDSIVQILQDINRQPAFSKVQQSEYNTPVRKIKSRAYSNQGDCSLDVIHVGGAEQRFNTDNIDDTPNSMLRKKESVLLNQLEKVAGDALVPQNTQNDQYAQEWEQYEEESRWKFPSLPQSKMEPADNPSQVQCVPGASSVRKPSQIQSINLQINVQEEPEPHQSGMATVRLEQLPPAVNPPESSEITVQSHHSNTIEERIDQTGSENSAMQIESRYTVNNNPLTPASKKKPSRNWLDIDNECSQDIQEDQLPEESLQIALPTTQSIFQHKKSSAADNYRLISEILEETEQDAEGSVEPPFEQRISVHEEYVCPDDYQQNRSKTLDPAPLRVSVHNCDRRQSLMLDPHSDVVLDELEEMDLNSPIKKKSNNFSPIRVKETEVERPHNPPLKKKRRNKRDLKELMRMNGNSPYLEYLPNMLNKEMQHKKSQQICLPKGKGADGRPSKTTRTGQQHKVPPADSENCRPECDLEDF